MFRKIAFAAVLAFSATAAQAADIVMHRSEGCGCCLEWAARMKAAGHTVKIVNDPDLAAFKKKAGVQQGFASCHTSRVEGYTIEGHVPAADIARLLKEKPKNAIGLAVPGMPMGSPGMEHGNHVQPYTTLLLMKDGTTKLWARHS
ncbi:DUF411 domain-containing protein [Sphingomicrobium sp. XHP0235]|uniref:DUF411 domain-containing protein n=1 Tax=Sphingomicrobium aquimarinum TaxID=3133971 RepID=UPI0031FE5306